MAEDVLLVLQRAPDDGGGCCGCGRRIKEEADVVIAVP